MLLVDDGTCFETLYADAPDRGERQRALSGGVRLLRDAGRRDRAARVRRIVRRDGRSGTGGRRRSRPTADTSRRPRCRCSSRARPIGVLAFHFTVPVNFDEEYQALLVSVAQHCAQALDRARLYESAQRARAEAENANRLKDEFVSIVSHELRTPLNAMLGWTSMLQNGSLDSTTSDARAAVDPRQRDASGQADRRAARLLAAEVRAHDAGPRRDRPARSAPRHRREHDPVRGGRRGSSSTCRRCRPVRVHGDPRRLEQVFFNLLGNALKFTPRGGRISVAVRAVDGSAEIRVSDTGAGIDPAFLPHVFDRFRQADSHTAQGVRRRRARSVHREGARRSARRSHHGRERRTGPRIDIRRQPADRVSGRGGSQRRAGVGDVRGVGDSLACGASAARHWPLRSGPSVVLQPPAQPLA